MWMWIVHFNHSSKIYNSSTLIVWGERPRHHEDGDPLSFLRTLIILIRFPLNKLERWEFFPLHAAQCTMYICTNPWPCLFFIVALGTARPCSSKLFPCIKLFSLSCKTSILYFSSVIYSRPLCCCNIHASVNETTWLHVQSKTAFTFVWGWKLISF